MNRKSIPLLAGGLGLLALAALWAAWPWPRPRPDLPEIAPFTRGERIALLIPGPETLPPPESLGLVQRAHAARAQVRFFVPGESLAEYAPDRVYQPYPEAFAPAGYHPDQWPALPPDEQNSPNAWQMLVLTPAETAVRNQAVLAAARTLHATGTDDAQGTREAALLSRARRAEIYFALKP